MPTRFTLTKEQFRLLHQRIVLKIDPTLRLNDFEKGRLLPVGKKPSPFYGTRLNQFLPGTANSLIKDDPIVISQMQELGLVSESGEWRLPPQFGLCLAEKNTEWKFKDEIVIGSEANFLALCLYACPECYVSEAKKETFDKIKIFLDSLEEAKDLEKKNQSIEDRSSIVEPVNIESNYYIGSYYSVISYEIKHFGFSLAFSDSSTGATKIWAEEWGFHEVWDKYHPSQELLDMDNDEEEGLPLKEIDFLKKHLSGNTVKSNLVTEVQYVGDAKHCDNYLYCNLQTPNEKEQLNFIFCVEKSVEVLKNQKIIRGGLLTQSSQGSVLAGEVILNKVSKKEQVFPLDLYKQEMPDEIDLESQKRLALYIMLQRRLIRVKIDRIQDISELRPKEIVLDSYISSLPGVYRVWNIGFSGQITQSRIHITSNFKAYLIPFFRIDKPRNYKVQWCWLNINKPYENMVSLTSYVGLSIMNHAVIDFAYPVPGEEGEDNNEDKMFVGVFSSAGHIDPKKRRKNWGKGGVMGAYMLLRKETQRFKVREFNLFKREKDGSLSELQQGRNEFENYVKKHGLETFRKRFEQLMEAKYKPIHAIEALKAKSQKKSIWGV